MVCSRDVHLSPCGIHFAGLAGTDDTDAAEGWEHIERPNWGVVTPGLDSRGVAVPAAVLPPPPTEPELIEQWTRAMFTDHVGPRDGAQQVPPSRLRAVSAAAKECSCKRL